ncbi:type IV pilus minor pilin PilW [Geomonas silvestris]|uniref:Type IV pilus minor pilin PilW n=1 Tax=Geomonas silvestris TaxID=2740184 RepID=A0A6V8MDK4_9BACT|nr:prepilin-type N-terminal cleavage/methylation domain-containing protein [Geomonas silvestris]GFO58051.1 type IV pilus minor pilin PilW [Geomonas silvestris]
MVKVFPKSGQKGFTLAEVMVAMALFMVVIALVGKSFNSALHTSTVIAKSEESNIDGVLGLEMLRHDIVQAGYGLYTLADTAPSFSEAAAGTLAADYNDTAGKAVPRGVVGDNDLDKGDNSIILSGTDYLAIKGTSLGTESAAQKWSYMNYTTPAKIWTKGEDKLSDGVDKVITLRQVYSTGNLDRKLVFDTSTPTSWALTYRDDGKYASTYHPTANGQVYYYYGLGSSTPRAPFNRVDYLVKRVPQEMSKSCAPGAGTLYKTVLNQSDGSMTQIPLLDCVADMQVVLGWNATGASGSNVVDTWSNANGTTTSPGNPLSPSDPAFVRSSLKVVKVFILAQDGVYDRSFNNPSTPLLIGDDTSLGSLSRYIDLSGPNYQHYRWKLYRFTARPTSL